MSANPQGVPSAVNPIAYPTRPQWLFTFYVRGELKQRVYHVHRAQEAESRFANDEPDAYDVSITFEEIPL